MGSVIPDERDKRGLWRKSRYTDGYQYKTQSGQRWSSMKHRCKVGGEYQERRPTYIGCTMSENFKDFQYFTEWHRAQVGYSAVGYHLDKDILFDGNKIYSEDACILVPPDLNVFLTDSGATRGEYAQGVYWHKGTCKFRALIHSEGKRKHIGLFTTQEGAFCAYKRAKEAEAYKWYERLRSGEFIVDPRVTERMRTWTLNIDFNKQELEE